MCSGPVYRRSISVCFSFLGFLAVGQENWGPVFFSLELFLLLLFMFSVEHTCIEGSGGFLVSYSFATFNLPIPIVLGTTLDIHITHRLISSL